VYFISLISIALLVRERFDDANVRKSITYAKRFCEKLQFLGQKSSKWIEKGSFQVAKTPLLTKNRSLTKRAMQHQPKINAP
jgi:transcription initiation factor TFIIIB Brf1 subunit/transcription initiation factor TFIIB